MFDWSDVYLKKIDSSHDEDAITVCVGLGQAVAPPEVLGHFLTVLPQRLPPLLVGPGRPRRLMQAVLRICHSRFQCSALQCIPIVTCA